MKKIKYKISKDEAIGLMPNGAICECYLIFGNDYEGVIYTPKKTKYYYEEEWSIDSGDCGSISFACFNEKAGYWERHYEDYINLEDKETKIFENKIKKRKI